MTFRSVRGLCVGAAGLLVLASPTMVRELHGQTLPKKPVVAGGGGTFAGGTLAGGIEGGGRAFVKDITAQQRGKLEDYKDVRPAAIEQLLVKFTPADSFAVYQFTARQLLARDQSMWLRLSHPAKFDVDLRWDRIPHTYSTDGRALDVQSGAGIYVLPSPRPDSIAWRASPYFAPIRNQWDPLKFSFALTPNDAWTTKAEYTRVAKSGDRPMGMAFGGPSNPSQEILEPIRQTTHDLRLSQAYADRANRFEVSGSWDLSIFRNALPSVQADNPQQVANTAATGAGAGRTALTPDNSANTGVITGALHLPGRTRVLATLTHSWMRQDAPFIPNTTNTLLAPVAVPRASLGADVQTAMYNVSLSSHPARNLTLSARARSFDYRNNTAEFAMPNLVIDDRSLAAGDTTAARPFTKANSEVGATYRLPLALSLSAAYAWEKWTRDPDERNVAHTVEKTPRVSLDYDGQQWFMLRGSYSKGSRRGDGYAQTDDEENPDNRRFDEADRDRERINVLATIAPLEPVSVTLNWGTGHDAYPNSPFGTQSDNSSLLSGGFDWAPFDRLAFGAGVTREDFNNVIHERYRTGSTPTLNANPTFDWIDHNTDRITTTFATVNAKLVRNLLDAGGSFSLSDARFHVFTYNPLTPTAAGATATQMAQATAADWPVVTQRMQPMTFFLRYAYRPEWALTLRYQFEGYSQNDFRTRNPSYVGTGALAPQIGNFYFLGNYYQNTNPGWITLVVTWNPAMLPFAHGRSTL